MTKTNLEIEEELRKKWFETAPKGMPSDYMYTVADFWILQINKLLQQRMDEIEEKIKDKEGELEMMSKKDEYAIAQTKGARYAYNQILSIIKKNQ